MRDRRYAPDEGDTGPGDLRTTIQQQIAEWQADGLWQDVVDRCTQAGQRELARKAEGDEPMTITEMAVVCRDMLAWDSPSFLSILGVEHVDVDHAYPTERGWQHLIKLNGGPLDGDALDFTRWDT